MGEGSASALSLPSKTTMKTMKAQVFPEFFQAFQPTNSNTILFERGFEDLGHPQCLMAFPGTEDICSGVPLCVFLSPICLSWDTQSEPSCEAAGARGGTGRWSAASRGRVQTYTTMNAPTAKRPQIIIVLALQSELALCNQIQALSCDLPVAAGEKNRTLTRRFPIKSADQGLATGTKQTSSPAG